MWIWCTDSSSYLINSGQKIQKQQMMSNAPWMMIMSGRMWPIKDKQNIAKFAGFWLTEAYSTGHPATWFCVQPAKTWNTTNYETVQLMNWRRSCQIGQYLPCLWVRCGFCCGLPAGLFGSLLDHIVQLNLSLFLLIKTDMIADYSYTYTYIYIYVHR